jgi:hypothetical protein
MVDYDVIINSNLNDYLKNYKKMFDWDNRLLDLNTEKYDKNIAFFGCSLTYGHGVENNETYPHQVHKKSGGKYNCLNFGVCGGSLDLMSKIYNKVMKELDIDLVIIQWPDLYRRMYFHDGSYYGMYPWHQSKTREEKFRARAFTLLSNDEYCASRNLPNLQVLNSFNPVLNLVNFGWHCGAGPMPSKEIFNFYGIDNMLDFSTPSPSEIEFSIPVGTEGYGHPNGKWYEKYVTEYLYEEIEKLL